MSAVEITIFAFATCATPGPVNMVASVLGAQNGVRVSIPFVTGATLGLSFVILVSSFGVSQILKTNTMVANAITLIGSVYLLHLAYLMSKRTEIDTKSADTQTASFYQGALLQILNPKAWLVSMSGLAMFLNTSGNSILAVYILMFSIACFVSIFVWVCFGSIIARRLKNSYVTIFTRSMAAVLSMLVICNLAKTLSPYFR